MKRRKRVIAVVLVGLLGGVGGAIRLLERPPDPGEQRAALRLHLLHGWWIQSGSPEPPQIERYVTYSPPSTGFVYNASHNIRGHDYQGLFGYRDGTSDKTYVVARGGDVLVIDRANHARIIKLQPEDQPAKPPLLVRIKRRIFK
jgi:hypothetical protein